MKLRISDLMDVYEDDSLSLPLSPEVSPERIRERTMLKCSETGRKKPRLLPRLLLCAALAAVLSVSAIAAYQIWGPGDLFDGFFALESAPLNQGQKELLDEIGTTDLPPAVSGGTTLTPLAAISDEHNLYLRLRVEAPAGTVLPDMREQEDHVFLNVSLRDTQTGELLNWGMQKARFLPDNSLGDNVVELVFMLYGNPDSANWNDGVPKTLYLSDLLLYPDVTRQSGEYVLLEGDWSFEVSHFYQSREIEVDAGGAERWDPERERMVTLEELKLSPLSASFTLSYPAEGSWPFTQFEIELVCRDGSSIVVDGGNGFSDFGPDGQGGRDYFYGVHAFDAPIPLDQIDHIQFGAYKLLLPE